MVLSVVRVLAGVALVLAICGSALAAPVHVATTWSVTVGGESADHALQAQAFLPTQITIDQDDTQLPHTGRLHICVRHSRAAGHVR